VVDVVQLGQEFHVSGVAGVAGRLQRLYFGQRCLIHVRHQDLLGVGVIVRDAGHHVGDDESAQVLLMPEGVLDGQDSAPRMAVEDEVAAVEPESTADLLHLVDEAFWLP
jgi:hypothetical protein